jgi:Lrp/AsnC family transcriptional regulator
MVAIETGDHSPDWLERFAVAVRGMPEVMEVHRMTGDIDYLMRVAVPDMSAYDAFYKKLIGAVQIKKVTSRFSVERVKWTTAYPVIGDSARST